MISIHKIRFDGNIMHGMNRIKTLGSVVLFSGRIKNCRHSLLCIAHIFFCSSGMTEPMFRISESRMLLRGCLMASAVMCITVMPKQIESAN